MKSFHQFLAERKQVPLDEMESSAIESVAETVSAAVSNATRGKEQLRMLVNALNDEDMTEVQELVQELSPKSVRAIKIAALDNDIEVNVASVLGISAE